MDFSREIPKFTFTRPDPNLNDNRTPCSVETSLLQQLVLSRRRYLSAIDDEISATTSITQELQEEIVEMEVKMDEKRSMLALLNRALAASHENRNKVLKDIMSLSNVIPVARRLPDEILLRIFMNAVELEEEERRALALEWRSYSLGKAPLTISGVCRRWRYIALGIPALSGTLAICQYREPGRRLNIHATRIRNMVQTWRSGEEGDFHRWMENASPFSTAWDSKGNDYAQTEHAPTYRGVLHRRHHQL
jgi:F-box-like